MAGMSCDVAMWVVAVVSESGSTCLAEEVPIVEVRVNRQQGAHE